MKKRIFIGLGAVAAVVAPVAVASECGGKQETQKPQLSTIDASKLTATIYWNVLSEKLKSLQAESVEKDPKYEPVLSSTEDEIKANPELSKLRDEFDAKRTAIFAQMQKLNDDTINPVIDFVNSHLNVELTIIQVGGRGYEKGKITSKLTFTKAITKDQDGQDELTSLLEKNVI